MGLERAGMETVAFCENDKKAQLVLKKHWPDVPIFDDIKNLTVDSRGNLIYIDAKGGVNMAAKKVEKYNISKEMYDKGFSIQECSDYFGITRQAMHKILKRRGVIFRKQQKFGKENHFFRGTRSDKRAQHLVEKALKKGILVNPGRCEKCSESGLMNDGRAKVQAHHDDYEKPLTVRWICQKCHYEWHKKNKAKGETGEPAGAIDVVSGGFP